MVPKKPKTMPSILEFSCAIVCYEIAPYHGRSIAGLGQGATPVAQVT